MFNFKKKKKQESITGTGAMMAKPDQMTHRFIINLPRGQKTVVRVSPLTILGDLVNSVCEDKSLDLHRHVLQIPGKPGMPVDLGATVQQIGVFELNLIPVGLHEKNHTASLPDLSKPPPQDGPPSFMPSAGEHKKKRGFFSFLSKKDKKYKPHESRFNVETSSTTSHMASVAQARKPSSPPLQRRGSDVGQNSSRPKSMFVRSPPAAEDESPTTSIMENMQPAAAPTKKKRRAPAPPGPTAPQPQPQSQPTSSAEINGRTDSSRQTSTSAAQDTHNTAPSATATRQKDDVSAAPTAPSSRAELLSRLHSRNSSDSSGYHELTLSGCESPEAAHHGTTKFKTSIDSTSLESAENANGDSGIHESPIRVSPIEEVQERTEMTSVSSAPPQPAPHITDTLPSKKKRKAPAPPVPVPQSQSSTTSTLPTATTSDAGKAEPTATTTTSVEVVAEPATDSVQNSSGKSVPEEHVEMDTSTTLSPALEEEVQSSFTTSMQATPTLTTADEGRLFTTHEGADDLDDDDMDIQENIAFDINEILEGVVFDEEPKTMELHITPGYNSAPMEKDTMMMMETASVTSEDIAQVDVSARTERPCAFIPPPPPSEPPPPEQPVVDINSLTSAHINRVFVDKGTEVNDDNTSLAPSSVKSSPENVPSGYKTEMALFVERMSKMAVESAEDVDTGHNDDSSVSLLESDTNSDTGSVIQHLLTDSKDSRSGSEGGSLTREQGNQLSKDILETEDTEDVAAGDMNVTEEISVPVETLPPPPEFGDKGGSKEDADEGDNEEDEEYFFTETVEELIIPIGPNGYDFSAARKVSDTTTRKEHVPESPRPSETKLGTGVFRAEPVSITPASSNPVPIMQSAPKPAKPTPQKQAAVKEEFVLTTEDLSSLSFLPPRIQSPRQTSAPSSESGPFVHSSSKSLVMEKHPQTKRSPSPRTSDSSNGSIQQRMSQLSFRPKSEAENDAVLEEKPITLLQMPSMRGSSQTHNTATYSDDEPSDTAANDPITNRLAPHLLVSMNPNVPTSGSSSPSIADGADGRAGDTQHRGPLVNGADADEVDEVERPGSRASAYSVDTQEQQEALQAQYLALQSQFGQWQEQLARNQSLLASQAMGPEQQAGHLQQLTDQMAMQQQMMQQLQSTMQTLQQQQQLQQQPAQVNGQDHRASSVEIPAQVPEPAAAAAEPAPAPPQPPPPPPASSQQRKVVKSDSSRLKQKPKFERELDPREQLMIAIRNFNGRGGLRSVPIQKTNWIHSNR